MTITPRSISYGRPVDDAYEPTMTDTAATLLVALVMIVGLAGTVIPFVPGLALILAAAIVYGLLVGFGSVGTAVAVVLALIVCVGVIKSIIVPQRMAEGSGVSRSSQLVALLGAVLGLLFIPVIGVVVGALVGLFAAELVSQHSVPAALRSTWAVAKGIGLSTLIDVGLAMLMIGVWSLWALTVLF